MTNKVIIALTFIVCCGSARAQNDKIIASNLNGKVNPIPAPHVLESYANQHFISSLAAWKYDMKTGIDYSESVEIFNRDKNLFKNSQANNKDASFFDLSRVIKKAFEDCGLGKVKSLALPLGGIALVSQEMLAWPSTLTLLRGYKNPEAENRLEYRVRIIVFLTNSYIPECTEPFDDDKINSIDSGVMSPPNLNNTNSVLAGHKDMLYFNKETGRCIVRIILHKHSMIGKSAPRVLSLPQRWDSPESYLVWIGLMLHLREG